MNEVYYSLGLMSGTSGDGVDASIIKSDGENHYKVILDNYFKYDQKIFENIHDLKEKINNSTDLKILSKDIQILEKEITLFHSKIVNEIMDEFNKNIDFIGFHGQTIFHKSKEKISKQLGDAKLLSQLTKKIVVYSFRKNDLSNGGEGAPLASIFHQLIAKQNKIDLPVCFLNIGGIANITLIKSHETKDIKSYDIGPGNCLIDKWIRIKTKKKYDNNGLIAQSGRTSKIILNQALDNFHNIKKLNNLSFDIKDFDLNFVRGLSLEDGASTLTEFSARIIEDDLSNLLVKEGKTLCKILVCGGGRKNATLMKLIKKKNLILQPIDDYGVNGDFVESQAFAYLAIRSFLNLPISFPETTGCKEPCVGGIIINNF